MFLYTEIRKTSINGLSTQSCGGRIAFLLKETWLASTDRRHS